MFSSIFRVCLEFQAQFLFQGFQGKKKIFKANLKKAASLYLRCLPCAQNILNTAGFRLCEEADRFSITYTYHATPLHELLIPTNLEHARGLTGNIKSGLYISILYMDTCLLWIKIMH